MKKNKIETKTYYNAFRLVKFSFRFWIVNLLSIISITLIFLIPGRVLKFHFEYLADKTNIGLSKIHGNEEIDLFVYLLVIIGIFLFIEFLRFIFINTQMRTTIPFFVRSVTLLRRNILKNILKKPGSSALPDSPGEAISRFRGDAFQIPMFTIWFNNIIASSIFSIFAISFMLSINKTITHYALAPFFLIIAISVLTTKKIDKYRKESRKTTGIVTGFLGEIFGAVQAIKISSSEHYLIKHFNKLNDNRRIAMLKDRLFEEILNSIYHNATALGTGMILIVSGRSISNGQFTIGDFALFVFYLEYISNMATFAGLVVARNKQIAVNISRMNKLMENGDTTKIKRSSLTEFNPIYLDDKDNKGLPQILNPDKKKSDYLKELIVKNLHFSYKVDSKFNLENISFKVRKNSLTVITGRIGSGKSTLLKVLLGLLTKNSGDIFWNNNKIDNCADFFVPPISAYTSQSPKLFSSSLKDNILMGLEYDKKKFDKAIYLSVFEKDLLNLENGVETKVGPKGVKLSGGQIQRVAAARMFYRNPELLVYDDLSSALDIETEQLLWERIFNDKSQNSTMLAISHRKSVLKKADQIILLKHGKIDAIGSLDELLETSKEMNDIYNQ